MCNSGISYAMEQYNIESIHRVGWRDVDNYIEKGHKILEAISHNGASMFIMGKPRPVLCDGSGWETYDGEKKGYQKSHEDRTMVWENKIGSWRCPMCGWKQPARRR